MVVLAVHLTVSRFASGMRGAEAEAVLEIAHQSLDQGGLSGAFEVESREERERVRMSRRWAYKEMRKPEAPWTSCYKWYDLER